MPRRPPSFGRLSLLAVLLILQTAAHAQSLFPYFQEHPADSLPALQGYMNAEGKIVVRPEYARAYPFSEGRGVALLAFPSSDSGVVSATYRIFDIRGRTVKDVTLPVLDTEERPWRFSGGLLSLRNGVYLDTNGVVRLTLGEQFPELLDAFDFQEERALILALKDDEIRVGYIDPLGHLALPLLYERLEDGFSEGLACVGKDGHAGYIDRQGKWAIPPTFDLGQSFSERLAAVLRNGLWGYVDKTGKSVITPRYLEANAFRNGRAWVREKSGRLGAIDPTGKVMVDASAYQFVGHYAEGMAYAASADSLRLTFYLLDVSGQEIWRLETPMTKLALPFWQEYHQDRVDELQETGAMPTDILFREGLILAPFYDEKARTLRLGWFDAKGIKVAEMTFE